MDTKARLSELSQGYQHSVVLLTAVKAGIFASLGLHARSAAEVAADLHLDARACEIVLLALTADGVLIQEKPGQFRIHPDFAPALLPDSPETQVSILKHNHACMLRWVELETVLKTGLPAPEGARDRSEPEMRNFICGMANISRVASVEVAKVFDFSPYRRMIDVGGGPATSSIIFARNFPNLSCVVFDLESPLGIAREEIAKAGMADRISTRAGDYFKDELGEGFDLAYVSNIIHSMGPDETLMLARKCHRALTPGGTIIIKEFFLDDSRAAPPQAAFFSVNMLTGTENGKSYTVTETRQILAEAKFTDFRSIPLAAASGLLIARKA
ncbi:MAG: methyltransferase [Candidatus Sumerlaeota bacterium]|nr:methyltransferase [Candidatus Sumerlaeota bacterium]